MSQLLDKLLSGVPLKELVALVGDADDSAIAAELSQLTDAELQRLDDWAEKLFQGARFRYELTVGMGFHVYRLATEQRRPEAFAALCSRLGVSKTKAYDSTAIFRRFGATLLHNPELCRRLPLESLKLLSTKTAPLRAGEEALELAARGERVSIKVARGLLDRHTLDAEPATPRRQVAKPTHEPRNTPPASPPVELWSYDGRCVRVVVVADEPKSIASVLVQDDVGEAFQKFQSACAAASRDAGAPDAA